MLGTLIFLLQEESERICCKALPPEMCRKILIEQGGWQTPSAIAWKNMEGHNRSQLDRIRENWRRFNALVAQKRKENCSLYYSAGVDMYSDIPRDLGDHRFRIQRWVWQDFVHESIQRMLYED